MSLEALRELYGKKGFCKEFEVTLCEDFGVFLDTHSEKIECLAFASRSLYLISGSKDHTLRVWDIRQLLQLFVFSGDSGHVKCISVSSDEKFVITGSKDKLVRIWNLSTKALEKTLPRHESIINFIYFIPFSNNFLSCCGEIKNSKFRNEANNEAKFVYLWSFESQQIVTKLNCKGSITALAISSSGKFAVSCGKLISNAQHIFCIWNLAQNELEGDIEYLNRDPAIYIALRNDKIFFALSSNGNISMYDIEEKRQIMSISYPCANLFSLSIIDDYVLCLSNNCLTYKNIENLQTESFLTMFSIKSTCMAVCNKNSLICIASHQISEDKFSEITFLSRPFTNKTYFYFEKFTVNCIHLIETFQYLAASTSDFVIRLWDINKKKTVKILEGHHSLITSIDSSTNFLVSGSLDKTIKIWTIQEFAQVANIICYSGIDCIAISKYENFVISVHCNEALRFWNTSGENFRSINDLKYGCKQVKLEADNMYAVVTRASSISIHLCDLESDMVSVIYIGYHVNDFIITKSYLTILTRKNLLYWSLIGKTFIRSIELTGKIHTKLMLYKENSILYLQNKKITFDTCEIPANLEPNEIPKHQYFPVIHKNFYIHIWDITKNLISHKIGFSNSFSNFKLIQNSPFGISLSDPGILRIWDLSAKKHILQIPRDTLSNCVFSVSFHYFIISNRESWTIYKVPF